ncbi:MAG TPA: hypothetical protein VMH23_15455 [Bacteroidota bacterium]|nr:hypothetical protein [Bacteroidota bacterium]
MAVTSRLKWAVGSTAFVATLCLGIVCFSGCAKSSGNPITSNDQNISSSAVTSDVADAVSDALASNNGGALDQVNDIFELSAGLGIGAGSSLGKIESDSTVVNRSYDSTAMAWSLFVYKEKSALPLYFGTWTRSYWYQFIANGQPQKFRVTNNVAADNIHHKLLAGTGYYFTPRLVHHLRSISSDWTASNTNTDSVTINGTYSRSGVDTILAAARKGTVLDHSLTLTFVNVRGPRGLRLPRSERTSGTIEGVYTATITAPGKDPVTVTKTFTVTLGSGSASFSIDGTRFLSDLATGDH